MHVLCSILSLLETTHLRLWNTSSFFHDALFPFLYTSTTCNSDLYTLQTSRFEAWRFSFLVNAFVCDLFNSVTGKNVSTQTVCSQIPQPSSQHNTVTSLSTKRGHSDNRRGMWLSDWPEYTVLNTICSLILLSPWQASEKTHLFNTMEGWCD